MAFVTLVKVGDLMPEYCVFVYSVKIVFVVETRVWQSFSATLAGRGK